jgi:hypothetical protein
MGLGPDAVGESVEIIAGLRGPVHSGRVEAPAAVARRLDRRRSAFGRRLEQRNGRAGLVQAIVAFVRGRGRGGGQGQDRQQETRLHQNLLHDFKRFGDLTAA